MEKCSFFTHADSNAIQETKSRLPGTKHDSNAFQFIHKSDSSKWGKEFGPSRSFTTTKSAQRNSKLKVGKNVHFFTRADSNAQQETKSRWPGTKHDSNAFQYIHKSDSSKWGKEFGPSRSFTPTKSAQRISKLKVGKNATPASSPRR